MGVTDDAFLGGALAVLQPAKGYRAGIDAVLLAASVPLVDEPARVLDAGAGVGTAGLCVARRCPSASVVLIEREPALVEAARENIGRNALTDRVALIEGDIEDLPDSLLNVSGAPPESFDHVIANPPYHIEGAGTAAASALKARAHAMAGGALSSWCRFLARMAKPGGTATIIHKADALGELLTALDGRFGGLKILPIAPRQGEAAIRVLIRGKKGSRAPLALLSPAVMHIDGNGFTPGAERVLRLGARLDLDYWKGFEL